MGKFGHEICIEEGNARATETEQIAIWKPRRERPRINPALTALRRKPLYQTIDLGCLPSRSVRQ
jgi:hypothetical protein